MCVVKWSVSVWSQIHFPPNLQKDTKKDRGKQKRGKDTNKTIPKNLKIIHFSEKISKQEL